MRINVSIAQFLHLGAAGIELKVMLPSKADGPMTLVGGGTNTLVSSADPGLSHRHFSLGRQALRYTPDRLIGNMTATFHVNGHIGAVVLHCLESTHRPPKLGALLGVLHRHIQYRIGTAQHLQALARNGSL